MTGQRTEQSSSPSATLTWTCACGHKNICLFVLHDSQGGGKKNWYFQTWSAHTISKEHKLTFNEVISLIEVNGADEQQRLLIRKMNLYWTNLISLYIQYFICPESVQLWREVCTPQMKKTQWHMRKLYQIIKIIRKKGF